MSWDLTLSLPLSLSLLAFGFCEYGEPDSTLRALRLLHDFKLGEKNLVVSIMLVSFPDPQYMWNWGSEDETSIVFAVASPPSLLPPSSHPNTLP